MRQGGWNDLRLIWAEVFLETAARNGIIESRAGWEIKAMRQELNQSGAPG